MEKYQWLKRKSLGPRASTAAKDASEHERAAADRDRRAALPPRSLTAAIFGDPLPGYSALELRLTINNAGIAPAQLGGLIHDSAS